jgi:flagellar biosynthesis protein FlhB
VSVRDANGRIASNVAESVWPRKRFRLFCGLAVEERTEEPTPKKRAEGRRRGAVARSPLLTWAFVLACVVAAGSALAPLALGTFQTSFDLTIATIRGESGLGPTELLGAVLSNAAEAAIHLLLVAVVAALAAAFVQVGPLFSLEPLGTPLRIRSGDRLGEGLVAVVVTGAMLGLGLWFSFAHARDLAALLTRDPASLSRGAGALLERAAWLAVAALAVLGLADYAIRRVLVERSLRMTRSERRRAEREEEGDPATRARRRREHARIAGDPPP